MRWINGQENYFIICIHLTMSHWCRRQEAVVLPEAFNFKTCPSSLIITFHFSWYVATKHNAKSGYFYRASRQWINFWKQNTAKSHANYSVAFLKLQSFTHNNWVQWQVPKTRCCWLQSGAWVWLLGTTKVVGNVLGVRTQLLSYPKCPRHEIPAIELPPYLIRPLFIISV